MAAGRLALGRACICMAAGRLGLHRARVGVFAQSLRFAVPALVQRRDLRNVHSQIEILRVLVAGAGHADHASAVVKQHAAAAARGNGRGELYPGNAVLLIYGADVAQRHGVGDADGAADGHDGLGAPERFAVAERQRGQIRGGHKAADGDVLDLIRHQHFGYHVLVTVVAVGDHPVRILDDVVIGHERAVVKRHEAAAGRQKLVIGVVHLQHQHGFGRALNGVRIGRKAGFRQCAGGQEQAQGQDRRCKSLHNISPSVEHYIILLTRSQLCCRIPTDKAKPRSPAFSR